MTSILLKCIPCARSGKFTVNERPAPERVYAKQSSQPVESRVYHATVQQTPAVPHARGFEIVEMDTIDTGNGIKTDTKAN